MKNVTFRITTHAVRSGVSIVEILLGGQVCAVLYPDDECEGGVKLASAHFAGDVTRDGQFPAGVRMDTGEGQFPPIPALRMQFKPQPYTITNEGIQRLS